MLTMRSALELTALCATLGVGALLLAPAREIGEVVAAVGSPEAIAEYRLGHVSVDVLSRAAEAAIADDDGELAASIDEVATSTGRPFDNGLRSRIEEANAFDLARSAREAWAGATTSDVSSPAGLAGVVLADLSGVGDLRDLANESGAWMAGSTYDPVTLGLAAVGLSVTTATVLSIGAATPARVGTSVLKAANKAGKLSRPLRDEFVSLTSRMIDKDALRIALTKARAGDLGSTRAALANAVNGKQFDTLSRAVGSLGSIARVRGYRATVDILKTARNSGELARYDRLATGLGTRFRGVVALLGAGSITLIGLGFTIASWIAAALLWTLTASYLAYRIVRRVWRLFALFCARPPNRKPRQKGGVSSDAGCG